MEKTPSALNTQFKTLLAQNKITPIYHAHYLKWLRYYLDFCHKYGFDESSPQRPPNFIKKLKEKSRPPNSKSKPAVLFMESPRRSYNLTILIYRSVMKMHFNLQNDWQIKCIKHSSRFVYAHLGFNKKIKPFLAFFRKEGLYLIQ